MTALAVFTSVLLLAAPALAQIDCTRGMAPIDREATSSMSALDFTRAVSAKEATFAKAFAGFGYTVEVSVETLQGDAVDGAFHQTFVVASDGSGARTAKPQASATNTLTRLTLAAKDIDTLVTAPPFALTSDVVAEKDAVYSGRQEVGDHKASVFDLLPRNDQAPLHGFIGRVWVWASRSAVLKSCGRIASFPIAPMRYEILRGRVAEENWFPVLMRADEEVRLGDAPVHVRVNVKYSDYKAR
jgi:hypothetical protein